MCVSTLRRLLNWTAGAGLMLGSATAMAEYELNLTQGVTPISVRVYDLHMMILTVCIVIGVVVFGAIFYSIIMHRKSRGAKPAQFHESTTVEIIWTIVPFLILVGMAIPATQTLIAMEDTSNSDVSIKVTGYQWKWQYEYLDEGVSFFSTLTTSQDAIHDEAQKGDNYLLEVDNHVVVPVGKKIRFLVTSADVIHAWWVPDIGMKKDAIPGFVNEMWAKVDKPGIYRGQCAELCGKDHGFMPIVVEARSDADYSQWVKDQKMASAAAMADSDRVWEMAELMKRGEAVYNGTCAACHQANGAGIPGVFPGLVNSAIVKGPLEGHIDIVVHGKAGTAMQAFGPQLSDADLAAVITYERNAWGNDTGDSVQPSAIKAVR